MVDRRSSVRMRSQRTPPAMLSATKRSIWLLRMCSAVGACSHERLQLKQWRCTRR